MYYNSTSESGQTLINFANRAKAQDLIILDFFQSNPHKSYTAWEAWEGLSALGHMMLFTSVRRGITDLVKASLLINTGEKVIERYNRPNFKFKLNQ